MRDKEYKVRAIRLEDKVWQDLMKKQKKSKLSWNQYIKSLVESLK